MQEKDAKLQEELESRIAMLTDSSYDDISLKQLNKWDFTFIGLIVLVCLLALAWGWS